MEGLLLNGLPHALLQRMIFRKLAVKLDYLVEFAPEVVEHGLHQIFVARRVNNSVAALVPLQRHVDTFCNCLLQLCFLQLLRKYVCNLAEAASPACLCEGGANPK